MSHQRAMPSQIFGQPHSQAYEQQRRETADRQEAAKTAARRSRLRELETEYRHLPPLPPRLPSPPYMVHDTPVCHADDAASAFYVACSGGNLDHVRAFVQEFQPPAADLAYALEEACQNFRLDVVRFLLQQSDTRLHHRCFRRSTAHPEDDLAEKFGAGESRSVSQSIFTSGHPRLIDLLKTFLEFGWHPNQLLGPLQKGKRPPIYLPRQEVALHYPRCILDLDILRLLLDAGADPTIARDVVADIYFDLADQPVQRMSGHILEMAVNLGTAEAVTLLLSRGARPAYGIPLHSLARRRPDSSKIRIMDDAYTRELWHETPELQYPTLSTRLTMAGHLISHGEDINRIANVYVS